jgi:hypothetical protein
MKFPYTVPLAFVILLKGGSVALGQGQPIQDLGVLVGMRVIAQRAMLCQPSTFTAVFAYAGKPATVVSLKPKSMPPVSQRVLSTLPPGATRELLEGKGATILVQFQDGKRLDTCYAIVPSQLADYFELVPGQQIASGAVNQPATPAASPPVQSYRVLGSEVPAEIAHSPAVNLSTGPVLSPAPAPNPAAAPLPAATIPQASPSVQAQRFDELSSEEVRLALSGGGRRSFVEIQDMTFRPFEPPLAEIAYITIYMPGALIAIRTESARKQFLQYEPDREDRRRSIMIVAHGYVGRYISGGCDSITRIVLLSDPSGRVVEEPYLSEPLGATWQNAFGATNECQALRVKFAMDSVQRVKAAAPNGEFLVAVFAGSVKTKMYKVKKKHQFKLGLD